MTNNATTVTAIAQELAGQDSIFFWLVLRKDDTAEAWRMHALLVEACPEPSNARPAVPFTCTYGHVVALAGHLPGGQIGAWLTQGCGVVSGAAGDGHKYSFEFPPFVSPNAPNVMVDRVSSHLTYGATTSIWPYVQYRLSLAQRPIFRPDGPFVGNGDCPSFPNFHTLVADRVYGMRQRPSSLIQLGDEAVTIRVAQTQAWIDQMHLSPSSLAVTLKGYNIAGARLEITGSPDIWFSMEIGQDQIDQIDDGQIARLTYALPQEAPPDLWVFLSRDGALLDQHYPTAEPSPLAPIAHNVTVDAGGSTTTAITVYSPSTVTPGEAEVLRHEIDTRAALFDVSDAQLERYIETFLDHYRQTLETFFPYVAPRAFLFARYPFHTHVLRLGDRGFIIGYRPSAAAAVTIMHPADFDPPLGTVNVFDVASRWQTPFVTADLSAKRYDAAAAAEDGTRQALNDALEIFWSILSPANFTAICTELLRLESIEVDRDSENMKRHANIELDAVGAVFLHEPAGFRRMERWGFQFKHLTQGRISVSTIRELEKSFDSASTPPDIVCLLTPQDLTSVGTAVARSSEKLRIWDRSVLDVLVNKHLDAISHYFPEYAEAVERLTAVSEPISMRDDVPAGRLGYFEDALASCPSGGEHFSRYEAIGTEMWEYLFTPDLKPMGRQLRTRDARQRRDTLFRNGKATPFWRHVGERFGADYIIVDFKNYGDPINADVIHDVTKYSNEALGRFIVVVSRQGGDRGVLDAQLRVFRDRKIGVIVVSNAQLLEMTQRKERDQAPEDVLADLLDEIVMLY